MNYCCFFLDKIVIIINFKDRKYWKILFIYMIWIKNYYVVFFIRIRFFINEVFVFVFIVIIFNFIFYGVFIIFIDIFGK